MNENEMALLFEEVNQMGPSVSNGMVLDIDEVATEGVAIRAADLKDYSWFLVGHIHASPIRRKCQTSGLACQESRAGIIVNDGDVFSGRSTTVNAAIAPPVLFAKELSAHLPNILHQKQCPDSPRKSIRHYGGQLR